jgi:hypothetical protein
MLGGHRDRWDRTTRTNGAGGTHSHACARSIDRSSKTIVQSLPLSPHAQVSPVCVLVCGGGDSDSPTGAVSSDGRLSLLRCSISSRLQQRPPNPNACVLLIGARGVQQGQKQKREGVVVCFVCLGDFHFLSLRCCCSQEGRYRLARSKNAISRLTSLDRSNWMGWDSHARSNAPHTCKQNTKQEEEEQQQQQHVSQAQTTAAATAGAGGRIGGSSPIDIGYYSYSRPPTAPVSVRECVRMRCGCICLYVHRTQV